jgi:hypothetical protein
VSRHNRPRRADERPLSSALGWVQADDEWLVRHVPGTAATKVYRCPGCDQEIRPGTAHVVAWPADGTVDDRRHWHSGCWTARNRRGPTSRRW